jgi:hypothetical protein
MDTKRASIFEDDAELDLIGFAPRSAEKRGAPLDKIKTLSEAANFVSREPRRQTTPRETGKPEPRRHRTGRNIQLNVKATADTIERFYKVADKNGWVLGETFERAITALERNLANAADAH